VPSDFDAGSAAAEPPAATTPAAGLQDSRWSRLARAALILGFALRFVYAFPVHKYVADADCLDSGLRAFRVLRGELPVFYTGARIGCLECYEHAAAFAVLGIDRSWLAIAPLLAGCALLVVCRFLYRSLLGEAAAAIALLFLALPPPAYVFWTYMPNTYPETILLCGAVLWLTDLLTRRPAPLPALGLGLAAGLGWWNSLQIVGVLLPSIAWLLWTRPALFRRLRLMLLVAAGFLLGALPWEIYNVRHSFASLRTDFPTRPAEGLAAVGSNLGYIATTSFPELVASADPEATRLFPNPFRVLRAPVIAIYGAAILFAAIVFLVWLISSARRLRPIRQPPPAVFLVLVACTVIAIDILSEAGSRRGLNTRYILPIYLCIAAAAGLFLRRLWNVSRPLAVSAAAVILAFNVAGYALWGTPLRASWRARLAPDAQLMSFLRERGVQAVCGNYWLSYPVNFLSQEKIVGIPDEPVVDIYDYGKGLKGLDKPLRWALIGMSERRVNAWARNAGLHGEFARPSPRTFLFLPAEESCRKEPSVFLKEIRAALPRQEQRDHPPAPGDRPRP
jgi:hypothetical protein